MNPSGWHEDRYEAVRTSPRSVVTGEARAGKSMLLKHSLLEWSGRRITRRAGIPVLVELRRLNTLGADQLDLVAQITNVMEGHSFKGAATFVPRVLEDGRLSVLFDGLDEVTADRLDRVVDLLRDFTRRYDGCQVVVTCRGSLYRGELEFATVVQVAELDDTAVRRLLSRWPGLDPAAQERLYLAIGANGILQRLVRSPLLLSMMAWLTADGITLPTSRAEFYDAAITHLVARDDILKPGRSRFTASEKLAVLRGLALLMQDRSGTDGDRLSISHTEALAHVRSIAASIDAEPKDAEPLLREIADRTGLLVSSGGVTPRYSFSHLTFQEYLAAVELRDDHDGLLARYDRDHNAWREAVIMWCGKSGRDVAPLIKELMSRASAGEHVLALECAAAAAWVDEATVTGIVDVLAPGLRAVRPEVREQAAVAFGNAGAGSGPGSAAVRERLLEMACRPGQRGSRNGVLRALALTGHDSAVRFLARRAVHDGLARDNLRTMGDLATPSLAARAAADDPDAIDDLAAIATPSAIEALLSLLDGSGRGARRAAWRLGRLVGDAAFADAVARRGAPTVEAPESTWIWQPFSRDPATIGTVARIAALIGQSVDGDMAGDLAPLDVRLVLAMVVVGRYPTRVTQDLAIEFPLNPDVTGPDAAGLARRSRLFDAAGLGPRHRLMIRTLSWPDQVRLLRCLAYGRSRRQWTIIGHGIRPVLSFWWWVLQPLALTAPTVIFIREVRWLEGVLYIGWILTILRGGWLADRFLEADDVKEAIRCSSTSTASTSILRGQADL